jgi:uncharacterized protein
VAGTEGQAEVRPDGSPGKGPRRHTDEIGSVFAGREQSGVDGRRSHRSPERAGARVMSTLVPVLLFLLAVFATTWTLPLLVRPPTGAESIWAVLVPLLPVVWAPTVIALILIRLYEGQGSLGNELRARLRYERGSGVWLAVAALVPMAALALATLTARATGGQAPWTPVSAIPLMVGVQVVTGAVGEELGWRGYLLPRLRGHLGAVGAGWAMAALWSLWHLPAFFTPGMPHQTMPMHLALLATLFFGVFLAFVFVRAGESIWAPMLAHLSFNIVSGLGGAQLSSVPFWRTLAGTLAAVAFLTLLASRRPSPRSAAA